MDALESLRREALLANPLLDFDRLLLVQRGAKSPDLGLPRNWQSNSCLAKTGYDDQIAVLSSIKADGPLTTLYRPEGSRFVGDVDLGFDADRLLFSMPGSNDRWQIFEIGADGTGLRQLTGEQPDVDSYDACYLPNGKILFTSTACFVGVPCVYGGSHVANLYLMDADGRNIRQLSFDQEHDWCPTVLNNGRILYSRWEYADTPHSNTRLLFHMNPDGTGQMEYYGSNSYWPNSIFYARPIPNHPTKVVGVVGGHHDHPRMGELVLFDPAQGRREADGAVQRIPGYGKKVEPLIRDGLTLDSWPKFLHPYPLSDKYFLVAARPTPDALWGIYLVDVFDNMLLLKELPGYALLEPIPLRATPRPPVVPEKVDLARQDAVVYLPDIYVGDGLKGIPRGKVKSLRVFTYHFAYQGMGGLLGVVGMDGPWDIKRVLGTVPVNADGSAKFHIPANVPISLQPLDEDGKALQLMRSWMTAMPGEVVQCSGCHEPQNTAPPRKATLAANQVPAEIQPWHGPLRGFSYAREVQPVIDRYCVSCHNGQPQPDGKCIPNLRGDQKLTDWNSVTPGNGGPHAGKFSVGYAELHRYVRRPGIESDYHLLTPMEYHADTTELVQMLKQGHHGVELDAEAWDRLVTWIDLNCPYHGTWGEEIDNPGVQRQRRRELLKLYGNVDDDPEAVPATASTPIEQVMPKQPESAHTAIECPGWPFDANEAKRRQDAAGPAVRRTVDLGNGMALELALVPAGEFVMGDAAADGPAPVRVQIDRPFWMGVVEVTNEQFARFDPAHDSRVESKNAYQFGIHGYPMNAPWQPVVRVSWQKAMAFCRWLSETTGNRFSLPTEAQWEYACRAGTATPFSFGGPDDDFSPYANLADAALSRFASDPYTVDSPLVNPTKYDDWIPKDTRFNDGATLTVRPGTYRANAWGLCDMHGNVAEWTLSPYRQDSDADARKVVRGGSWRDRAKRATSSFRLGYWPYQRVYNVGFRVVCDTEGLAVAARGEGT
jgi:formylglycine-generating enzyme required for sulfatase activity